MMSLLQRGHRGFLILVCRLLRKLSFKRRDRLYRRLDRWGFSRRLARLGPQVYAHDGRQIGVDLGDHVSREMFRHGWYESIYIDFIRTSLAERETVLFDVGANVGNHSLALAPCFANTLAFEPNPDIHRQLVANCGRNTTLAITPQAVGLSDRPATLSFVADEAGNSGQSGFRESGDGRRPHRLEVKRGDDFIDPGTRLGLIKIDVEGHELRVLAGLQQAIHRDRPAICLEWHTESMDTEGGFEALRALLPVDYELMHSASRVRVELVPVEPPYRSKYTMIFCLSAESRPIATARRF